MKIAARSGKNGGMMVREVRVNQEHLIDSVLQNKVVVITGATAGIGLQAVKDFATRGALVIGVGRSMEKLQTVQAEMGARFLPVQADLALQRDVRAAAAKIQTLLAENGLECVDVLVNNAGTFIGRRTLTEDGVERTLAVNHLAPFLLTLILLPYLQNSPDARVLTVSSNSHYHTWLDTAHVHSPWLYHGLWAYKTSKLCNVLFTAEFNRRCGNEHLRAYAVDPGLVNTEIGFKQDDAISRLVWKLRRRKGTLPAVPVRTMLHLASTPRVELDRSGDIYWRDSQPKQPSRAARNTALAKRLWERSLVLCGLDDHI